MASRTKAELIGQILQRVADGQFVVTKEADVEVITIRNSGISFEEKELAFRNLLSQLDELHGEMDPDDPHGDWESPLLEENWSDWWTEKLIAVWLGSDVAPNVAARLKGLTYEQVISKLYDVCSNSERKQWSSLINARERLASLEEKLREAEILDRQRLEVPDAIARIYARQIGVRFPRMAQRAEQLRVLGAEAEPPPDVQNYLQQATRCYIWGFYIGSLVLCRSAIEFALRERLKAHGKAEKLAELERRNEDTLERLIGLARTELHWGLKDALKVADVVRGEANKAVHRGAPPSERCKEMFAVTRGVLNELYSRPPLN
jgi:hypothetical protein